MDVFFVIASIFTVIIGTIVTLILWKILRLMSKVDKARETLKFIFNKWSTRFKFNKLKKNDHDKSQS